MLSSIFMDPNPIAFQIPFLKLDVAWYGILFASGLLFAYFFAFQYIKIRSLLKLEIKTQSKKYSMEDFQKKANFIDRFFFSMIPYTQREELIQLYLQDKEKKAIRSARSIIDRIFAWGVVGGVLGARLGHVFFYDWPYYSQHLLEIVNTRAGGLASHGGAIGAILGLFFLSWIKKEKNDGFGFLEILDVAAVGLGIAAIFIRIGNFINQEVLGTISSVPWAVRFGHPIDGQFFISRHPVQLYEAFAYLVIFLFLFSLAIRRPKQPKGRFIGLFLIFVFGFRFVIEFFKEEQAMEMASLINVGSWLSLPLIGVGLLFILIKPSSVLEESK